MTMSKEAVTLFPPEVWLFIISGLPLSSLSAFNLACRAFHALSTSCLYRIIPKSLGVDKSRLAVTTLSTMPELARHVRHLTLHGALKDEDASVHQDAVRLLGMEGLQDGLESFEFVYTDERHGGIIVFSSPGRILLMKEQGWWHSEDLLKDNIIWETLKKGTFSNFEQLSVHELPYGSEDHQNSLYHLTHWKRLSVKTHDYMFPE
ncbi:hypothetical protein BT69DRAFT_977909 [Atractiella rhizophila]|nr:hypothetical protein BT69DRAFT_977909 [Atractiella rhizophila]